MNIISLHNFVESDVIIILVMQRPQIWECFRAKLNLGGMPESLKKWKSENCDRWCERVFCVDFCTVFLGF